MIRALISWFCFAALLLEQESLASDQADLVESFKQTVQQCIKAKTPLQCREALQACDLADKIVARLPETPSPVMSPAKVQQLDKFRALLLNDWAWCEEQIGNHTKAEGIYRRLLTVRLRLYGPEHLEIASCRNNLGLSLDNQGKHAEAEALYRQALALNRQLLGPEHLAVATNLDNLAQALQSQGKYQEAKPLYQTALAMRIKLRGPEHLDVALSLNNLACFLSRQGHHARAAELHRQALAMRIKLLGPEHLDVAMSLNNLAFEGDAQGKTAQAEPLYRQALAMRIKLLGPEHPLVADGIDNLASALSDQGKYAQAEPLRQEALDMRTKLLGPLHPDVALSLSNVADVLQRQGQYARAEELHRQALDMRTKLLGPLHPDVAKSLNNLAGVLLEQGRYAEAEPLYRQALTMRIKLLGPLHPDVAKSLNNLALSLEKRGKYTEAEQNLQQALDMLTRLLGPEHPEVATCLSNLALVILDRGKYARAEALYRRVVAMNIKLLGPEHLGVALAVNNLAFALDQQGKYSQAEPLYRQALELRIKLLGTEHPDVAQSKNNLATVLDYQGQYTQAEPLYQQALELYTKRLGPEHPTVALSLNNLAQLRDHQGQYAQAELLYRQALELYTKRLGPDHPTVAASLNNMAVVLDRQAKYDQAEMLCEQAVSIATRQLGPAHPLIAQSKSNLAAVLDHQGKYEQAEEKYRQSLTMLTELLGPAHPLIALNMNYLANMYFYQSKYAQAEPLSRAALVMQQELLGLEHPDVAQSINNLAAVLASQGKYDEADLYYQRAVAMYQKLLGPEHPAVANALNNYAAVLLFQSGPASAFSLLQQAARIRESQLRSTITEIRMQALLDSLRSEEDLLYGLLLAHPDHKDLGALAVTSTLLRKGRVAEAGQTANRQLHRNLLDAGRAQQYARWQSLRQQREVLLYAPVALPADVYQARLKDLKIQAEEQEYLLGDKLPTLRSVQPPDFDDVLPAVARRLPADGVLIEIVWTALLQPPAPPLGPRWDERHYVALLVFPDQKIVVQDLGKAAVIDGQVRALRTALESSESTAVPPAKDLYEQIMRPLLPHLAKRTQLFLSVDGTLNLIPFDALHDEQDYLLGRYHFHYLTSGRDLLATPSGSTAGPALLLANPDFGKAAVAAPGQGPPALYQRLGSLPRLPGTQREALALQPLLRVRALLSSQATEEAVQAARSPWVLHIATHGLFLDDVDLPIPVEDHRMRSVLSQRSKKAELSPQLTAPTAEPLKLPGGAGPMSRSALVLAGAAFGQQARTAAQDGLLTAEEARSLDLDGTQLVVLSACETGKGALSAGQGVYGLRRAFLMAGVETLVTSLWRVDDKATGELMALYYRKLLRDKLGKLAAMEAAMQQMRKRPGREHPFYWAPFLVIGQDGPLRPPKPLLSGTAHARGTVAL